MVAKLFTPEEVEILKSNPYTARVSEKTISFTRAFKEAFWNGYLEGRGPIQLVRELGYDTDTLGRRRVDGLAKRIRAEANSVQRFQEGSTNYAQRRFLRSESRVSSGDPVIQRMQAELLYLRQEMAFLKKIIKQTSGQR